MMAATQPSSSKNANESCPSAEQLHLFALGQLAEETSEVLSDHLRSCDSCISKLETIDDGEDSLIAGLRQPNPLALEIDEPNCGVAVAKALDALALVVNTRSIPDWQPMPKQIGEYEIVRPLGQGGMGTVYLARHTKLGREVAVKFLAHHRLADKRMRDRFEAEMRAVGRLSHPNIVTAHDAREVNGTAVLVTEYINGLDLGELLQRTGPLQIPDACEIIRQVAVALQYTHEQNLVHRDVKPSNVMLSQSGEVKLLDLGLARFQFGDPERVEITASGQAMGTVDYIAPEQVSDSRTVDIRSDIYSLGCTLFKLLTGSAPFADDRFTTPFAKMNAHVSSVPPRLNEFLPDAPADLGRLVDSMLEKDPARRPQTPRDVANRLNTFASGNNLSQLTQAAVALPRQSSVAPRVTSGAARTQPWFRRRVPISAAIAAGLGGMLIGWFAGILIKIKYPDGSEVTINAPDGSTVTIEASTATDSPKVGHANGKPELPKASDPFGDPPSQFKGNSDDPFGTDPSLIAMDPESPFENRAATVNQAILKKAIDAFNERMDREYPDHGQSPLTETEIIACGRVGILEAGVPDEVKSNMASWRILNGWSLDGGKVQVRPADVESWQIALNGPKGKRLLIRKRFIRPLTGLANLEPDKDPSAIPLAAIVAHFNQSHVSKYPSLAQQPLTEEELIAAICNWEDHRNDAFVSNGDFEAFQQIAMTRMMNQRDSLELMEVHSPTHTKYGMLSIRIVVPTTVGPGLGSGTTYAFNIRDQFVEFSSDKSDLFSAPLGSGMRQGKTLPNIEADLNGPNLHAPFLELAPNQHAGQPLQFVILMDERDVTPLQLEEARNVVRNVVRNIVENEAPHANVVPSSTGIWYRVQSDVQAPIVEEMNGQRYALAWSDPKKRIGYESIAGQISDVTSIAERYFNKIQFNCDINLAESLQHLTESNTEKHLAIVLANEIIAAPRILQPISSKVAISGKFTETENQTLLQVLKNASLQKTGTAQQLQPAITKQHHASKNVQVINSLRNICIAFLNFEIVYKKLPGTANTSVGVPGNTKKTAFPFSWRVAILPYIEQQSLYEQYHFDEPWDSEHNRTLLEKMPEIYRSPFASHQPDGETNFLGFATESGVLQGSGCKLVAIEDGTSNTILLVETKKSVPWTKPEDLTEPIAESFDGQPLRFVMVDGSVRSREKVDKALLEKLITRDGSEYVDLNAIK